MITASAGDDGYLNWAAEHAFERNVTSTRPPRRTWSRSAARGSAPLGLGGAWQGERCWNGLGAGGGGCSVRFRRPPGSSRRADWRAVGCATKRAVADVSADADPYTGVADLRLGRARRTLRNALHEGKAEHRCHWCTYGGTSLASPIVASVFALAGGAHGVAYPAANALREPPRRAGRRCTT